MSLVESEDLVADTRLFPVIRVAMTNDPSRSLSAEALIRFFSRCVGGGKAMQTASLWSLLRFFLKEYATQCVPFKSTLVTMMESVDDTQPLVRVLRSMIFKLYVYLFCQSLFEPICPEYYRFLIEQTERNYGIQYSVKR